MAVARKGENATLIECRYKKKTMSEDLLALLR